METEMESKANFGRTIDVQTKNLVDIMDKNIKDIEHLN